MLRLYNLIADNPRKYVLRPLIFYWALIFILTTIPGSMLVHTIKLSDKIEHILAYFGLAFLLSFAVRFFREKYFILSRVFITLGIAFAYGAFDELHQMLIPKRQADFLDLMADTLGAILGILIAELIIYLGDSRRKKNNRIV